MGRRREKPGTARARDRKTGGEAARGWWSGSRAVRVLVPLAGVFLLQLSLAWGRLDGPFLDTRIHWNYDNAYFTSAARDGNLNGDLRSQLGVTRNTYSRWGVRAGKPDYYTDHPFLVKALFQQVTRFAGYGEAVSRVFYVAVSFGIAAGLFAVVLASTGSAFAAFAGATTLVVTPLFASYQTCVKFEADGMLLGVWQLAALFWYRRAGTRAALVSLSVLTAAAFLAHWTSAVSASMALGLLLVDARRRPGTPKGRWRAAPFAGAALGLGLTLALMVYLHEGVREAWAPLAAALARRAEPIPLGTWLSRQWIYARFNFTVPLLVVVLAWIVVAGAVFLTSRKTRRGPAPLPEGRASLNAFVAITFATACVWQLLFRQGSFVHVYWQYWFTLPAAAIVASVLSGLRSSRTAFVAGLVLWAALVLELRSAAAAGISSTAASQLGRKDDVDFLASLGGDRFPTLVFVPYDEDPFNEWFAGPLFEYYTGRPIVVATPERGLKPGEKALILRRDDRDRVRADVERMAGVRLGGEKCGARICAYDVLPGSP